MKSLLLALSIALLPLSIHAQDSDASPAPLKPLRSDGIVSLDEIVGDFRSNPDAALQKYNGQFLTVYGRVGAIQGPDDDASDGAVAIIFLQQVQDNTPDVKVIIDKDELSDPRNLVVTDDGQQAMFQPEPKLGYGGNQEVGHGTPYVTVNQKLAFQGSFQDFEAGDIVLNNGKKVPEGPIMKALGLQPPPE